MENVLLEIQSMLLKEKYPSGLSQRQRLLAMEEAHEIANGYSYFDNGDEFSDSSSQSSTTRKIGKRLVLTP